MWPRKIHRMENTEWGDPLWYKKGKSKENTRKTKQKQKNDKKKQHCYYEKCIANITC